MREELDGIPRWVWDLDAFCGWLAMHDRAPDIPDVVEREVSKHLHGNGQAIERQTIMGWLTHCRMKRNEVQVTQDGNPARGIGRN